MKKSRFLVSTCAALSLVTVSACVTDPNTGTQPVAMITKYTVTELNLNTEPGPDQFTWKSLNVPDGTDFMREDESGEIKMWKVVNGELKFIASAGKPIAAK